MKRRDVVVAALAAANSASGASSPFVPFRLEIRRNRRFADLVDLDDCLTGQMFLLGTSAVDPGVYLCDTLELPYRNDQSDISAINPGSFSGRVRTDGARGWRIELDYPAKRLYIQIHSGNVPWEVRGCVLVGDAGESCQIRGGSSRQAMSHIQSLYGSSTERPIEVRVVEDVP